MSLATQQAPPSPTAIGIVPPPMPTVFGTVPPTSTPAGKELPDLDTHVEHYTRAGKGLRRLQFYNSTAGVPELNGWQPRDTRLVPVAGANALQPKRMPFPLQIAASSAGLTTPVAGTPVLAALTSEGNVTLTLGLRVVMPRVRGQVRGNAVTFARAAPSQTTPRPPTSDLSLRATISGLDVRVILHSARERGPFALTFAGATGMRLVPDPGGSIEVTQAYSYYGSTGTATGSYTRTEYTLQPPILLDSSAALTAPVSTGPATTTVSGARAVTLHIDPAWLADPHRVFPVTLDLPIATTYSLYHTGVLGTVMSCQPALPSPLTDIVVGRLRGCAYHGQVYFNLDVLPPETPIKRATLRMYTPARIATTRVMVYSNTAPAGVAFDPAMAPSWSSAPAYAGPGVAQSSGDGHWQSWDVTGFVQGWSDNSASNAGLALVGNTRPVSFTSPLGASDESPLYAPYLDIIFNPDPTAR